MPPLLDDPQLHEAMRAPLSAAYTRAEAAKSIRTKPPVEVAQPIRIAMTLTPLPAGVWLPAFQPPEGLAGWKLSFVADGFALFRRGNETAGVVVTPRR